MKLKCSQSDLAQALSMVIRAVSSNNTLPVLNNILLKAEGKKLNLSATNLEIAISVSIDATVENEGTLTVPAKALTSYIPLINDESVSLTVVSGNTLDIRSTGSDTKMKGISSEEFPALPKLDNPDHFVLPTEHLATAIEQVAFAASTNISRPVLTGLFWSIKGKEMKLVATDSYRLAERSVKLEKDLGLDLSFIVPSKTAHELAKALSSTRANEIDVYVTKGQILFKLGNTELMSRLIDLNFPPYEKVLPETCKTETKVSRQDFILALKKLSVIVRDSSNNVRLKVDGPKLALSSDETQVGQGSSELIIDSTGDAQEAALNVQYLLDVLSRIDEDQVYLGLNDKLSPVKVTPVQGSGYQYIIMPLKV
jgi:DNA polymerase-3 subunit beta